MNLKDVVTKYLAVTGGYGHLASLSEFSPDPAEVNGAFSAFDEDYHISRYLHFTKSGGPTYAINGFEYTHVSIDAEIQEIM